MFKIILIASAFLAMSGMAIAQKYVFYLHGKIVEDQGLNATNPLFGKYEYENILTKFKEEHFTVISECRKVNTDVKEYAYKVVQEIDSLLKKGAQPGDITVVGASKGSVICMYVSTYLNNPNVNFVFMSSCNDYVASSYADINFSGNILSIYEKSDKGNQSCEAFKGKSTRPVPHYKELQINTGLQHGYLYKPIPEWMTPVTKWANGNYN